MPETVNQIQQNEFVNSLVLRTGQVIPWVPRNEALQAKISTVFVDTLISWKPSMDFAAHAKKMLGEFFQKDTGGRILSDEELKAYKVAAYYGVTANLQTYSTLVGQAAYLHKKILKNDLVQLVEFIAGQPIEDRIRLDKVYRQLYGKSVVDEISKGSPSSLPLFQSVFDTSPQGLINFKARLIDSVAGAFLPVGSIGPHQLLAELQPAERKLLNDNYLKYTGSKTSLLDKIKSKGPPLAVEEAEALIKGEDALAFAIKLRSPAFMKIDNELLIARLRQLPQKVLNELDSAHLKRWGNDFTYYLSERHGPAAVERWKLLKEGKLLDERAKGLEDLLKAKSTEVIKYELLVNGASAAELAYLNREFSKNKGRQTLGLQNNNSALGIEISSLLSTGKPSMAVRIKHMLEDKSLTDVEFAAFLQRIQPNQMTSLMFGYQSLTTNGRTRVFSRASDYDLYKEIDSRFPGNAVQNELTRLVGHLSVASKKDIVVPRPRLGEAFESPKEEFEASKVLSELKNSISSGEKYAFTKQLSSRLNYMATRSQIWAAEQRKEAASDLADKVLIGATFVAAAATEGAALPLLARFGLVTVSAWSSQAGAKYILTGGDYTGSEALVDLLRAAATTAAGGAGAGISRKILARSLEKQAVRELEAELGSIKFERLSRTTKTKFIETKVADLAKSYGFHQHVDGAVSGAASGIVLAPFEVIMNSDYGPVKERMAWMIVDGVVIGAISGFIPLVKNKVASLKKQPIVPKAVEPKSSPSASSPSEPTTIEEPAAPQKSSTPDGFKGNRGERMAERPKPTVEEQGTDAAPPPKSQHERLPTPPKVNEPTQPSSTPTSNGAPLAKKELKLPIYKEDPDTIYILTGEKTSGTLGLPEAAAKKARAFYRAISESKSPIELQPKLPPGAKFKSISSVGTDLDFDPSVPIFSVRLNDQYRMTFRFENGQWSDIYIANHY